MSRGKSKSKRGGSRRGKKRSPARARADGSTPLAGFVAALGAGILGVAIGIGIATDGTADIDGAENPTAVWTGERVRVEIYNGGGVSGMAGAATERLRTAGFDVVSFGNATTFDPELPSQVVDRVGRPELARAVAETLGIDNVLSEPDPNLFVEVTVVVGGAWTPRTALAPAGSGQTRARWDPRGWFEN